MSDRFVQFKAPDGTVLLIRLKDIRLVDVVDGHVHIRTDVEDRQVANTAREVMDLLRDAINPVKWFRP